MTALPDHARTLAALEREARARPRDARAQLAIGQTLQHLARPPCGEDRASHEYFLGALGLGALPEAAPPSFVLGNLATVFAAVARVLAQGGVFAFTVEAGDADTGYDLLPTLRSEACLRGLAQAQALRVARAASACPCARATARPSPGS